nr:S-layer homology domain-containing protein [uncultured Oscillibacter sp.]
MKKFLSLVLALIMTMSLVTISAGATEYRDLTDKDEIQYEEAVAVLNRIGVITGYEDGSFRPETELTRGAAAKIIVSLMIGPDAASALPNNASPYPDVPAGHTFAGVIGYCKTAGYISGYGDGTFKPANPLTGYAFAKMLLGAIGYKSNIEGFVDTGWTMNVARIGNVAGLFDRISFDGAKSVTRDEACQLALNTLKATMVDYGNANTVVSSSGEVLTVQGSKAQYVTSNNRDINANINRRVINAANNEMTLEFGEEHFKDLRLEHDRYDPAYDIYGHPSNEWSYKKVTIGTFKLPADFTFTKQMAHLEDTVATKEKALGLRGYDTYSTDHKGGYVNWSTAASNQYYSSPFADATQIHINGWNARVLNDDYKQTAVPKGESAKQGNWYTYDARSIDSSSKDLAPSLSELCDLTDNGVTVEVYVCPVDADFITDVVVTRTQLMEVDRVASDFVELDTISPDSKDPRKDGKLTEIAGYNDYALTEEVISVKDNNYDAYNVLKDLKAGDEVAIIPYTADDGKTWEVGEAYVPETVSGALTNVDIYNTKSKPDGNAVAITVGGTTYPIAQWNKDMREITGVKIRATKKDVTLLLDKMGNALLAKDVGNSNSWIIVGDYYQATLSTGRVGWFVHGWTIKGDEVDLELGTIRGAAEKYAPGELVKYDVASGGNGEYELTKPMFTDDDYTNGRRVLKNGALSPWTEPQGGKDGTKQTGEGIYNIAQFANQNGTASQFNIKSNNSLLPLEFYNTEDSAAVGTEAKATGKSSDPEKNVVHFNYKNATANPNVSVGIAANQSGVVKNGDPVFYGAADQYNTWTYRTAPYDGVKFIFVGFDATNGEVEVINVVDGVQNVAYNELIHINRWWKNVGTNGDEFVASPAEAYVDKDGKVKAVVIKSDSAEANLKDLMIITDNRGANTSTKGGAEAPTSGTYYTRQYVSGEDGFKDEKTGYFDKALLVGDVVTGSLQSNGVIRAKSFHATTYTDRNPDGVYVRGIEPLKTQEDVKSKTMFYIGTNGNGTVSYLGTGVNGYGTLPTTAKILTNIDVMGIDQPYSFEGLVTVDSSTQFIDLRDGRPGNINELSDLFDSDKCDKSTVELKILLNGNESSGSFRHAYVIMVLNAKPAADGEGGSSDKVAGSAVSTSYKVNDRTAYITYSAKVTRPDWVPETKVNGDPVTVTIEGYISSDGFRQNFSVSGSDVIYNAKRTEASFTKVNQTLIPDETSDIDVVVTDVTWSTVKVQLDKDSDFEGLELVTEKMDVGTSNNLVYKLTPDAYKAGTVTVNQGKKELLAKANLTQFNVAGEIIAGSVTPFCSAADNKSYGAVEVTFDLTSKYVDVTPPTGLTDETVEVPDEGKTNTKQWVLDNLDPGVYVLEGLPKDQSAGSPFDQNCDSRDTRTFVYPRTGKVVSYTLTITSKSGVLVYQETGSTCTDGSTENSIFNVQVSKQYSTVFHNSDSASGSLAGYDSAGNGRAVPLTDGTFNWEIKDSNGSLMADGTFTVTPIAFAGNGRPLDVGSDKITAITPADPDAGLTEQEAAGYVDQLKALEDGQYVFPTLPGVPNSSGFDGMDFIGNPSDNRLFKYTVTEQGNHTFTMQNSAGTLIQDDVLSNASVGPHYFFFQVSGTGFNNAQSTTRIEHPLAAGTYPWQIRDANGVIVLQGTMVI